MPRRVLLTVLFAIAGMVAGTMVAQCRVAAPSTATPTATPIARLIDRFEVVAPPDASSSPLDDVRAASSTTLLLEDFEDQRIGIPPAFASGLGLHRRTANPAAPLQQGVEWARDGESGPGVALVQAAAAGLVRDLALPPGESAVVRARARAVGALGVDDKPGSLLVEALDRTNKKLRIAIATRFVAPLERRLDPKRAQEWQELELFVPPLADRAGIRLSLQAGAGGMLVDRVEVRGAQPWQKPVFEPRAPDDRSRDAWRRILRRGRERADCLVLGPGWSARCDVAIPASRPRLEVLLGAVAPPSSKPFTVVARFEGRTVAERTIAAPADVAAEPFVEWHVSLEEFAGRTGRLEIAASVEGGAFGDENRAFGPGGGALLVGAPLLLGSDDAPRRNLVLISIDTLRADHVGCYGAGASLTPNIDVLASRGTRFARMLSVSSWTLPSHATIFTGELPRVHGAVVPTRRVDVARTPTLAVALAEAGYSTAAFTGGGMVDPTLGFAAGFDRCTTRDPGKPASGNDDPMQPVVDWIDRHRDQSFFLFVHTYLVHDYAANPEYVARFPPPAGVTIGPELEGGLKGNARDIRPGHAPQLRALYPPSLAQADERVVGRLLAALEEGGLADRTVVSLLSDHGEQWLEHGAIFHGDELWTELTSIPWIVSGPGVPSGHVVDATVSHVDVAATLLGRVGSTFPFATTGRDAFAGGAETDAELEAELEARPQLLSFETIDRRRVDALVAGPWKLIRRHANAADPGTLLLFRRDVDPGEKDDLAAREPERVRQLARLLDAEIARCETRASSLAGSESGEIQLDPELEQELRDLGYLDDSR